MTVFDASGMIAFLRDEPGADAVEDHLRREPLGVYAHALNLCEVYYDFWRASTQESAEAAIRDLLSTGVQERDDLDPEFWREAGRLKAVHRRVSLADCCAMALANRLDAVLVSADRHELEPLAAMAVCRIQFIR